MKGKNIVTTDYSGNHTIPVDVNRGYFIIIMKTGSASIALGGGTGSIPIEADHYYEPLVAPTGPIEITSAGTYVVAVG